MNKQQTTKLQEIANSLPPVMVRELMEVRGEELIREAKAQNKPHPTDSKKEPIKAGKNYQKWKVFQVDHFDRLRRAYKKNGEKGVNEYDKWAREEHKMQVSQKPKKVNAA